jgi:hypothetical protein
MPTLELPKLDIKVWLSRIRKVSMTAARFSQAYEEQRELFRFRRYHKHKVSLPLRRVYISGKFEELKEKFKSGSLFGNKMQWRYSFNGLPPSIILEQPIVEIET